MRPQIQTPPRLLTLVDYHHPILRQKTSPVTFPLSEEDKQLIESMKFSIQPDQLKAKAEGMAANQWGINKRIFLLCPEADTTNGLEIIINPSYEPIRPKNPNTSSQDIEWEGCFSIPLARGRIQRYTHIRVNYQNEEGRRIIKELKGWQARVWQHENDHLDGLLYDDQNAKKCLEKKNFSSRGHVNKFYKTLKSEKTHKKISSPSLDKDER